MNKNNSLFISEGNLKYIKYPDTIRFKYQGHSILLSLNRRVNTKTLYLTVKMNNRSFMTPTTPYSDILDILHSFDQSYLMKITLHSLIKRTFFAIEFEDGWPAHLLLYRTEKNSQPLLKLSLTSISKVQTDPNDSALDEFDESNFFNESNSNIFEVNRIWDAFDELTEKCKLHEQQLTSSFNQRLDQMLHFTKCCYDKLYFEMGKNFKDVNDKCIKQQSEIVELKRENNALRQQIRNHTPNVPSYGELEHHINSKFSMLEAKLFDMKLKKDVKNESSVGPENDILNESLPEVAGQENQSLEMSYMMASKEDHEQLNEGDIDASSIIGKRTEMLSKETHNLTSDEKKALFKELKYNTSLYRLQLWECNIGVAEAKAFAKSLKYNSKICILDLGSNRIGVPGAKAIAVALESNSTLAHLYLSSNNIWVAGAQAIANALVFNRSLTNLDLGHNRICDDGAVVIAKSLKFNSKLVNLNLWGNCIGLVGAQAFSALFNANSTLTNLNLWGNIISDLHKSHMKNYVKSNSKSEVNIFF